jgi:hypothetical protein
MAGMGWIIGRARGRSAVAGLLAVSALCVAAPAIAAPAAVTVHTSRGGTCRIHVVASRAATEVAYGVRVEHCRTKFGVRYAQSRGILYDESNGNQPVSQGYLDPQKGHLPYAHQRTVSGLSPTHEYRTRVDLSIVLKTRRSPRTHRLERWTHSGKHCRVKTTKRPGDTLGCEFSTNLP